MTQEQNIDFAKGLLVNSIYKSARLEGIDVTYNQVENILNDVKLSSAGKINIVHASYVVFSEFRAGYRI